MSPTQEARAVRIALKPTLPCMSRTCQAARRYVQSPAVHKVTPQVVQIAVDERWIYLHHLENRCGFFFALATPED